MNGSLLDTERIDVAPEAWLAARGDIFRRFAFPEQDSGNVSYGVRRPRAEGARRYFVKTAGDPRARTGVLEHADRCDLLRNAARLYASCPHPALARLRRVVDSPAGPLLVYDWAEGDLLGRDKAAPDSALARFRRLPADTAARALDTLYAAHEALATAGWVAVDLYLGALLYDFATDRLRLIDLDHYARGPFVNPMGRMFGSRSMMAPEEHERGARIDQATTVFTLGRAACLLLGDGGEREGFRGPDALRAVVARAVQPERARRFATVAAFVRAWRAARRA